MPKQTATTAQEGRPCTRDPELPRLLGVFVVAVGGASSFRPRGGSAIARHDERGRGPRRHDDDRVDRCVEPEGDFRDRRGVERGLVAERSAISNTPTRTPSTRPQAERRPTTWAGTVMHRMAIRAHPTATFLNSL
jgi:hypothetical protein